MTQASNSPKRDIPATGMEVLVVGAGLAGLAFAINAQLSGHTVRIVERRDGVDDFGDGLGLQESCLQTVKKWPGFFERLKALNVGSSMRMHKYDGTLISSFEFNSDSGDKGGIGLHRSDLHELLYTYALEVGLSVDFSTPVVEFFETEEKGGVILENGSKLTADVVVAADGVGTKSWLLVVGKKDKPMSSGFSIYRATYPTSVGLENPKIRQGFEEFDANVMGFMGPDAHIMISKSAKRMGFLFTHKDGGDAEEDWYKTVPAANALPFAKGWHPFVSEIIKAVPDQRVTDWKLMWRDPKPNWVSPKGRVVQIGDAAHAFLPTSGYGASMALEDGHSLAECLRQAGKENIPLALRVHNILRFERSSCAQKMGFKNREAMHKTDWDSQASIDELTSKRSFLSKQWGPWLTQHDPEEYARQRFSECANHVRTGAPFVNTNGVPGYTYKPWSVQQLLDDSENGRMPVDEGEWY